MTMRDVCENTDLLAYVRTITEHDGNNVTDGKPLEVTGFKYYNFAMFYFGFCALISHILLAGITAVVVHKCVSLKMVHTAAHAFYCTVAVSSILSLVYIYIHCKFMFAPTVCFLPG